MSIIILNKKIFTGTSSNVEEPEAGMLSMGIDIDGKLKVKEDDGNVYTIGDSEPFIGLSYSRLDIGTYVDNIELISNVNNSSYRFLDTNVILFITGLNTTQYGSFYEKWILKKNNVSIGLSGSYTVQQNDLELLSSTNLSTISDIQSIIDLINPNAIRYSLGLQSTDIIEDIVNINGPFSVGFDDDIYFTFNTDVGSYIYRFLITTPGLYGDGEIQVNSSDFLLIYSSVSEQYIEGTYDEIYTLKQNSSLVPNRNYIITDYVNEYIINGTDTSKIVNEVKSIGAVSGYLQFPLSTTLPNGTVFTIVDLPPGYSGTNTIGQSGVITASFGTQYYIFSVFTENAANIGVTFQYELPRYSTEFDEVTLYDSYGKVICKPGGVLNTDVHDSTSYGTISGIENMSPPIERIVLTAISTNKFSENVFSDTFEGDFMIYDINDNIVSDLNGNFVKNKKGSIKRRWNNELKIDINKDWRSQKYRRYRTTDVLFNRYKMLEEVYKVQTPTGVTYSVGGIVNTLYSSSGHRYTLLDLENSNHFNDFTNGDINSNIFSSSVSTSNIDLIDLMTLTTIIYRYSMSFNLTTSEVNFKDYNIIPLDNTYTPTDFVDFVKVKDLDNTIFLTNNKNFGLSSPIYVDSEYSSIKYSTFLSGGDIVNGQKGIITKCITFDTFIINNNGVLNSVKLMSNNRVYNSGSEIFNTVFGSAAVSQGSLPQFFEIYISDDCKIYNSIISSNYTTNLRVLDSNMSCCFFNIGISFLSKVRFNGHLTALREGTYNVNTPIRNLDLDINTGFNKNTNKVNSYGYDYKLVNTGGTLFANNDVIKTMSDTKELYELNINSGIISTTIVSTPT